MEALAANMLEQIENLFREVDSLFGQFGAETAVLDNTRGQMKKFGMFGVKAPYYLAFYSEEGERYQMNMGYQMQQMALQLCCMGLGTCFLGSMKLPRQFQRRNGKKIVGLMAFGRARGSHVRKKIEAKRLSLDELCIYKEVPRQWMNQLLEAARMAPSTLNSQPWRFVVYDNRIHIFSKKHGVEKFGKWDELNFGIMFANMMVAAEELWLDVDLIRLGEITQKNFSNSQYVLSAILRA